MNKKTFLIAFLMLFTGAVFAQDSTMNGTNKQHHRKSMHNSTGTMPADSVNGGKIITNPNGKMGTRRKTPKNTTKSSTGVDSAR